MGDTFDFLVSGGSFAKIDSLELASGDEVQADIELAMIN